MTKIRAVIRRSMSAESDLLMKDVSHHRRFLSPFQLEKFTYMFKAFFDFNENQHIEEIDVVQLGNKIRQYCGWKESDEIFQEVQDVLKTFLECLDEQVVKEKESSAHSDIIPSWSEALAPTQSQNNIFVSLDQWLNLWGRLCHGAAGLGDFPCWVQLLPSIFFRIIDTDKDGVLSKDEYRRFYKEFIGISDDVLDKVISSGYRQMTADGEYKLTLDNFQFCFANFLLGRSIYGPGKYIFGVFDNRDIHETFKVSYSETEE